MDIYLYQKSKHLGPFTEGQLRQQVKAGEIDQSAFAWHEGQTEWLPLHQVITGVGPVFPPAPKTYNWGEDHFEWVLFNTRLFVLFAVFGSLAASIVLFIKGSAEIVQGISDYWKVIRHFTTTATASDDKTVMLDFIPAIDNYLFATVLLIFSMGIYELFVSKIDPKSRKAFSRPDWLNIKDLDDLKTHISEVVVMILIINFFEAALKQIPASPLDLVWVGGGIALIAGSLFVTHKIIAHRADHKKHRVEGTVAKLPMHEIPVP